MDGGTVSIGNSDTDHVPIAVVARMHPGHDDYWDGNWLVSPITVAVGGFTGSIAAGLRAEELVIFRHGLEVLYRSLAGEARLDSMEDWLHLVATGDGRGHVTVEGTAMDTLGVGNQLSFELHLDQTLLPTIIDELISIETSCPILGSP